MRRLDHIDLRVTDRTGSIQFYKKICATIGFPHFENGKEWACFCSRPYPQVGEYLALTEERGHRPSKVCYAFWVDSKADVDRVAQILRGIDAPAIEGPAMFYQGHYAVYFEDPSGNHLEVCYREYSSDFDPRISHEERA